MKGIQSFGVNILEEPAKFFAFQLVPQLLSCSNTMLEEGKNSE